MKKVLTFIIIILLIAGGAYFYFSPSAGPSELDQSLNTIEDVLAEAFSLKAEGDAILAGKSITKKPRLIPIAQAAERDERGLFSTLGQNAKRQWEIIRNVKASGPLVGFHSTIEGWIYEMWQTAEKMATTRSEAERKSLWEKIKREPPPFTLDLPDHEIIRILETKINAIVDLKEAGDAAISINDRQGMLTVASRLRVQNYYLKYHLFNQGNVCPQVGRCYEQITQVLPALAIAATDIATGGPVTAQAWTQTWTAADLVIGAGGPPVADFTSTAARLGITLGEPDVYKIAPTTKAFFDNCSGKGGVIGGTGGIKAGLPTTESGFTCWHDDSKECWDYLTFSGDLFFGGSGNCQQKELKIEVPKEEPVTQPPPSPPPPPALELPPPAPEPPPPPPPQPIPIPTEARPPAPAQVEPPPPPPAPVSVTGIGSFTGGSFAALRLTLTPTGGPLSGTAGAEGGTVIINGSVTASGGISGSLSGTLSEEFEGVISTCSVKGSMSGQVSGNGASGSYGGSCGDDSEGGTWFVKW